MKHTRMLLLFLLLLGISAGLFAQTWALDFDGNDAVSMGNLAFTGTSYTAECWIYPTALPAMVDPNIPYARTILASSQVAGSYPIWIGTTGTNLKVWSYSTNQDTGGHATVGLGLTTNTWYHVAVTTVKGGTTKLYVDGVEKLSFTNLGQGTNWNNIFTVGELRPGRLLGFFGKILDVRIWNSVLTPAQIIYGMNNDLVGNESGLIGYWPFSEGSGTTAYDQVTSTPHNGILSSVASGYDPAWTSGMPYVNITSTNPSVAATTVAQGTDDLPLTRLTLAANGDASTLNTLTFTTSGTYIASDIENFKLYYNTTDNFSTAAQIGTTITSSLGAGSHTFTAISQALASGATRYFWIASDVSATAIGGNTIYVNAIMTSDLSVTSRFKTGTSSAGGLQTFDIPLPVELSSFTAVLTVENYVTVKWVTQSETGVGGYYVYRSLDNEWMNAMAISSMIPSANSPIQQVYQYTDNELEDDGTYYYWLQIQDLDGSTISHGPISVNYSTGSGQETPGVVQVSGIQSIFPNPITPYSVISYNLTKATDVSFKIYNSRGQLVNRFNNGFMSDGDHNTGWNGKDSKGNSCPTGIYFIKMQAGRDSGIRKAVIIK
ncbi:MAG: hypothetical protein CVU50_06085 [Candidatus Cloacimonetes bacterium HGW-Cloacimonetes-3]|nr:MAG: hypothetical protein CVU50_06085 [Candidatus Cloacimonetes bacterium HGW-Cloacimonetes-3]